MTVKERILLIRLSDNMNRHPTWAEKMGLLKPNESDNVQLSMNIKKYY